MESRDRSSRARLVVLVAATVLIAIALGLVFNGLSPLGIRFGKRSDPVPNQDNRGTVASSGSPALLNVPRTNGPQVRVVTWQELKPRLAAGGVVLIDARPAASYQVDHIPGAISIPPEVTEDELLQRVAQYSKTQPIVVYCASRECHVSRAIAQRLIILGFLNVENLEGGMAEYQQAQRERGRGEL